MKEITDKLIEKIADAVGILYDPKGIKKGERAFSEIIYPQTATREDLTIEEKVALIQEYEFLMSKNDKRMKIISKADKHIGDEAQPYAVDDSWIFNFWDKAGNITDDFLQEIWGHILAQEVNKPNSISKRLLHNLSLMSVTDANNFMNLARFCFDDIKDGSGQPLIYIKEHANTYSRSAITTKILKELELFSLIETNYETGFAFDNKKVLKYQGAIVEIKSPKIKAGNVRLTEDGQQLYKIVHKRERREIFEYTMELLQYMGCEVKIKN